MIILTGASLHESEAGNATGNTGITGEDAEQSCLQLDTEETGLGFLCFSTEASGTI